MSNENRHTGFSPHGTPESSLGVTATTTSSSSDGVKRPMPKRALPAAPATRRARSREESPERERELVRQRSDETASRASSGGSSSSSIVQRARSKRLKAKVELMRAQYELALDEEEEALEKVSDRSAGARSRSSRGTDRLSVRVALDRDKEPSELMRENLNRFRAASQASGNRSRDLSPVAEDQVDDDASKDALHNHVLYENAAGTPEVPTALGRQQCPSQAAPSSAADRNACGYDGWEPDRAETESFRFVDGSTAADRNACGGSIHETVETSPNPYLNVFVDRRTVPASDTGSEFMSVRQEALADSTDPHDIAVSDSNEMMEIEDVAHGDPNTLSARDQELTNSGTTMVPVGAQSLLVGQESPRQIAMPVVDSNPMDLGGPSVTQNFTQINQNTVIQQNNAVDLSQTLHLAEQKHQQVLHECVQQAEVNHLEILRKHQEDAEARIRLLEERATQALQQAESRTRAAESAAMAMRREAHVRQSEMEAAARAQVEQAYQRGLQESRAGSTTCGSEAGQSLQRSDLLFHSPAQSPKESPRTSIKPIEFTMHDPCGTGEPNGPVVSTPTVVLTTRTSQTRTSQVGTEQKTKPVSTATSSSGQFATGAGGQQPSGLPPTIPHRSSSGGASSSGNGNNPPNAGSSNDNQGGRLTNGQQPPGGDGGDGGGNGGWSRVPSEASDHKKPTNPGPKPPGGDGPGGGGGGPPDGGSDADSVEFIDALSVNNDQKSYHVHRVKELDEIKIKDFPNAVKWRAWSMELLQAINVTSGRPDDEALKWAKQALDIERVSEESLIPVPKAFARLDRKLSTLLIKLSTGQLGRKIQFLANDYVMNKAQTAPGILLLRLVAEYFVPNKQGATFFSLQDLCRVKCNGADVNALEDFQNTWELLISGMAEPPALEYQTLFYYEAIHNHPLLKVDINHYDREEMAKEKDGNLEYLMNAVEKTIRIDRERRNKKAISDGIQKSIKPAVPAEKKKAKSDGGGGAGAGRGRGHGQDKNSGGKKTPKGGGVRGSLSFC